MFWIGLGIGLVLGTMAGLGIAALLHSAAQEKISKVISGG